MEFPESLEGFGYKFNEDGKLRSISTGEPYQFHFKEDNHSYNQKRYEALGDVITNFVYERLEDDCGLKRFSVPLNPKEGEPKTSIFCSENYNTADKLLILIHGSGVVRAGQWARRLIINDSLNSGTQIPFIKRGLQEGYGIIVMNTNDHTELVDGKKLIIEDSESPETHGKYVWKNFVRKSTSSHVAIIAHSYGGVVLTKLADKFANEFHKRVFAVALTDSVHFNIPKHSNLKKVGRNWIGSCKPLDTLIERPFSDIACVSAGCMEHEMTSFSSFNSIFQFFSERLSLCSTEPDESDSQTSPEKRESDDFEMMEDNEENLKGGNPFERNDHSISPDIMEESSRLSEKSDLNEIAKEPEFLQPMQSTSEITDDSEKSDLYEIAKEPEVLQPMQSTSGTTGHSSIPIEDLVMPENSKETTASSEIVDMEIEDLTNSQVVGKVLETSLPEVNVVSKTVAPLEEDQPNN